MLTLADSDSGESTVLAGVVEERVEAEVFDRALRTAGEGDAFVPASLVTTRAFGAGTGLS